ncbi:MAG TPA: DUF2085 domain-containing protein [Rubricoccaceae bacterium]|nr:DUF2085 domain-containing protein [Rubricoccaceae bacterium]
MNALFGPPDVGAPAFRWAGWGLALAPTALLVGLLALPPFVGEGPRALLMALFDPVCHQLPARSFAVGSVPFAVCHRCTGVLGGLLLGVLLVPLLRASRWSSATVRVGLLAALVPMALDWSLDALGWWGNAPASRFGTGLVFGLAAGLTFARALALPSPPAGGPAASS